MDRKFEPVMISGATQSLPSPTLDTAVTPVDSQRVLRNTYWLLALSMLPTVAGTPDFKSGALDRSANLPNSASALNFLRTAPS